MAGRSHNVRGAGDHAGQAVRHGGARSCCWRTSGSRSCSRGTRCAASRARWAPRRTCWTCSAGAEASWRSWSSGSQDHLRVRAGAGQRRPGLSALAGLRRGHRAGPGRRGAFQRGDHHPADGRRTSWSPRASSRARSARQRHAAQDEHPILRAGERAGGGRSAATPRWPASWPETSGTRATCPARWSAGSRCRTRSSRSTGCSRRS